MSGDFVEHAFKGSATRFYKIGVEATDGLFFRRRWDDDSRVGVVHGGVEPVEVAVSAGDSEDWGFVGLGGCLLFTLVSLEMQDSVGKTYFRAHLVDDMTASQIANFMWISHCDVKRRSRCLLYTHAWLVLPPVLLSSWRRLAREFP